MYNMMSNCYIIYFIYIKFYLIVCVCVLGGGGNIRKQEIKMDQNYYLLYLVEDKCLNPSFIS